MLLSFARIDGSSVSKAGLNQVIAFDHREGRMPVTLVQIQDEESTEHGRITLMSWLASDGMVEAANITGDAPLLTAYGRVGFLFAQLQAEEGVELDHVQVIAPAENTAQAVELWN